jgi:hypothetical protein
MESSTRSTPSAVLEVLKAHPQGRRLLELGIGIREQLMRNGEGVDGPDSGTPAPKVLVEETKGRLASSTWEPGLPAGGDLRHPQGEPGGVLAQQLMASACANEVGQVELLKFLGNGSDQSAFGGEGPG